MAIAYDNSVSGASATPATTLQSSAAFTPASAAALFAFMASGAGAPNDPAASGCKWGAAGTAMTKEGTTVLFATNIKLSRFSLVPPTVASRVIDGTWAGTDDERAIAGISFTGVDQASPLRTSPTPTTGNSAAPSITATTVAGDEVIACLWLLDSSGGGTTITSAGGQTNRQKKDGGVPFSFESFAVDHKSASGTSTTLSWTLQRSCDWIVMAYVAKPSAGGTTPTITDSGDEVFRVGEIGIVIDGTGFGATQNTGNVIISPTDNVADVNAVVQTVTAWGDTQATVNIVRGALPLLTNVYLFVKNDGGLSNTSGRVIQLTPPPAVLAAAALGLLS